MVKATILPRIALIVKVNPPKVSKLQVAHNPQANIYGDYEG